MIHKSLTVGASEGLATVCSSGSITHWSWRIVSAQAGRRTRRGASIDSQSVKTTESGVPRGDDAGKKVKGRKAPCTR
jgi:hypothetical protein